jgi:hypothetical protein
MKDFITIPTLLLCSTSQAAYGTPQRIWVVTDLRGGTKVGFTKSDADDLI